MFSADSFACNKCDELFGTRKALDNHMKNKHQLKHRQQKRFSCDLCDFSAHFKCHLKRHQLTHTKKKDFVCSQCKKRFGRKETLNMHIKAVHLKETYKCEICPKSFAWKKNLHVHIHTFHQKQKPFVCIECGKSFGYSWELKRHERTNSHRG